MYVIGTAGHIDHGKSALIHRLTGIDPDRLREEKERGMTIDLGFAWLKIPDGNEIGIIDVPGHEKFIKNMLAGVGAIDLTLFVVAANESIMPQTKEHLAILSLLELRRGIVVITKKDLVDEETLNLVKLEIEDLVKGTFLQNAPVIAVSSVTGEGIDLLVDLIQKELKLIAPRKDLGRPRLFVDRVFTISGAGTVVTGTLIDGSIKTGQEVEILPSGLKARIRGLQSHKTQKEIAEPGSRVAINLANVSPEQLVRGDVITTPGWLVASNRIDVSLRILSSAGNPVKHGALVDLFIGSAQAPSTVHLLDKEEVKAGESAIAQITTVQPIVSVKGDHFIVRSPVTTLGGGVIINPHAARHKRFKKETINRIMELESGSNEEVLMSFLASKPLATLKNISIQCNLTGSQVLSAIDNLISQNKIIAFEKDSDQMFMTYDGWNKIVHKTIDIVKDYHRNFPARSGMPKGELLSKTGYNASSPVLQKIFKDKLLIEDGTTVRLPDYKVHFSDDQERKITAFLHALKQNPYSPQVDIIIEKDLLNQLLEQKKIVKVADNVIFLWDAYQEMVAKIKDYITENGKVTVAEVRDILKTSRKYALALMEYLDEKKITRRVGDERILR